MLKKMNEIRNVEMIELNLKGNRITNYGMYGLIDVFKCLVNLKKLELNLSSNKFSFDEIIE